MSSSKPPVVGIVLAGGGSRRMGEDKAFVAFDGTSLLVRAITALRHALGPHAPILVAGRSDLSAPTAASRPAPGQPRSDRPTAADATATPATPAESDATATPATPAESIGTHTDPAESVGTHTDPADTQRDPESATLLDGVQAIPDDHPGGGPLAGLASALSHAADDAIAVVVGIDHPLLDPTILTALVTWLRDRAPDATTAVLEAGPGTAPNLLLAAHRVGPVRQRLNRLLVAGERRLQALRDTAELATVPAVVWRRADPLGASLLDVDDHGTRLALEQWWRRVQATAPDPRAATDRAVPDVEVVRWTSQGGQPARDAVIAEEPLEIRAAGPGQEPVVLVTTMRTPGHEAELAVGWLLAEGLTSPNGVVEVSLGSAAHLARPDDQVTVHLRHAIDPDAVARRHTIATASCGVCGRASLAELTARVAPLPANGVTVDWARIARLPDELRLAQPRFGATGGVHAAGLADHAGRLVTVREDIGRHNALDAVVGAHVLGQVWPADGLHDLVLVLSGRIGFELVAKAATARVPIVCAVGAASDLAVRTAAELGITLVGFVRDGGGVVYSHPDRIGGQVRTAGTPSTDAW